MFKDLILCLTSFVWLLSSCSETNTHSTENIDSTPKQQSHWDTKGTLPNRRFGKSSIIHPKFDPQLIFGSWETTDGDPGGCCEINEKRYLLCDYDEGDPKRLYRIESDSIFLDNPYLIFKGKILKATGDTLIIHWQENKNPKVFIKQTD